MEVVANEDTGSDPFSDSPRFSGYNHERLCQMAKTLRWELTHEALKDYLEGLYVAAMGDRVGQRRIVEKSVENAEFMPILDRLTARAKFVAIVRNPYANFVALRRQKDHTGRRYPVVHQLIESLRHHHMALIRAQIGNPANSLTIRYEDLIANIEAVTREVMVFLAEPWSESLLRPSEGGEPWASNSTWGGGFEVSTESLHRWEIDITGFEVGLVNSYLSPVLREYGYERLESPPLRRWLLPNPKESPRNWLLNRTMTVQGPRRRPWS